MERLNRMFAGLIKRFIERGFVDDAGFARAKAGGLLRRGYGARRVGEALRADGIAEETRTAVAPGEADRREAAMEYARRRRFGPFAREPHAAHRSPGARKAACRPAACGP